MKIQQDLVHVQNFFFFWGGGWQAVSLGGGVTVIEKRKFCRVGDKNMFKMYKKAGVGREGDI